MGGRCSFKTAAPDTHCGYLAEAWSEFARISEISKIPVMKNILWICACAMLVSCGVKSTDTESVASPTDSIALSDSASGFDENNYESFLDLSNYLVDDKTVNANVQIIDSAAVVIINPTEEQIQEMEEKYGEDFF